MSWCAMLIPHCEGSSGVEHIGVCHAGNSEVEFGAHVTGAGKKVRCRCFGIGRSIETPGAAWLLLGACLI
jgi:hypothetical protein